MLTLSAASCFWNYYDLYGLCFYNLLFCYYSHKRNGSIRGVAADERNKQMHLVSASEVEPAPGISLGLENARLMHNSQQHCFVFAESMRRNNCMK